MTKIVAIGGGEIGRPGYPIETLSIDKEVVKLTGKSKPSLLFLGTASNDDRGYTEIIEKYYGKRLGCKVEALYLSSKPAIQEIQSAVSKSDIIYVGGGNTLSMMTKWRKYGLDKVLKQASSIKVLAGVSAGAICWFKSGLSDSRSFTSNGQDWSYIKVKGLGLYNLLLCPHFDEEADRKLSLKHALKGSRDIAIALENCTALEIIDDSYRIISSKDNKRGYKAYWIKDKYVVEALEPNEQFTPLSHLLT